MRCRQEQVSEAVVVEVNQGVGPPAARDGRAMQAASCRHVLELPVPEIAKQRKRLPRKGRDVDVGQPVVVVIAEVRPHARDRIAVRGKAHASQQPRFLEGSVAMIAEEEVSLGVIGDERVDPAVKIVVCERDAHALANVLADSRRFRDILERSIAAVPIEGVRQSGEVRRTAVNAQVSVAVPTESIHRQVPIEIVNYQQV